jgi:hypothetical protein
VNHSTGAPPAVVGAAHLLVLLRHSVTSVSKYRRRAELQCQADAIDQPRPLPALDAHCADGLRSAPAFVIGVRSVLWNLSNPHLIMGPMCKGCDVRPLERDVMPKSAG